MNFEYKITRGGRLVLTLDSFDFRTIHNALTYYKGHPQFGDNVADLQRLRVIQALADRIRDNLL